MVTNVGSLLREARAVHTGASQRILNNIHAGFCNFIPKKDPRCFVYTALLFCCMSDQKSHIWDRLCLYMSAGRAVADNEQLSSRAREKKNPNSKCTKNKRLRPWALKKIKQACCKKKKKKERLLNSKLSQGACD